jgi:Flp pilus assembly protein TadD
VATAAIFLIDAGEGDAEAAERLAHLPDAADPYVQFALGNHHARGGRWADAQRAYFAASKGDPDNADYAFNLAVSLDQLGQRVAARTWYTRALALHQPAHRFDPAVARARLATLEPP